MASTPAHPISNAHHIAYRCRDAAQTTWFYQDVLGLKLAAAMDFEEHSGVGKPRKYMHLFFQMADGNFLAFFDDPDNVAPDFFRKMDGFDTHVAVEVDDEKSLLEMQKRIQEAGITCLGPLDHHFVKSIYMFDPNGVQVELTYKVPEYDAILSGEAAEAPQRVAEWTKKTRAQKEALFGAEALDQRGKLA